VSKINDNSYKYEYSNVDAVDVVNLTYPQIKFIDIPEFILCVVTCIKHLLSMFSTQNDEDPVLCSDISHAGKCF
jgi:hypothetical protein